MAPGIQAVYIAIVRTCFYYHYNTVAITTNMIILILTSFSMAAKAALGLAGGAPPLLDCSSSATSANTRVHTEFTQG
jgi:hypothetical protein